MPGPVKSRSSNPALPFIAKSLQESARTLEKSGIKRGGDAFAGVATTAAHALETTAHVVGSFGGWNAEGVQPGAKYVAKGTSRGLSSLASTLPRVAGEARLTTVRELLADPDATVFSKKMLGREGKARSTDAMALSWAAYSQAVFSLLDVDAGAAAAHVAAVADSLAKAAALTTSPQTVKLAALAVTVATKAQQTPSRELTERALRIASATASVLPLAEREERAKQLLAELQPKGQER
jgi:hypothetical protein